MSLTLPPAILAYFRADSTQHSQLAACFTESAVVKDEGKTHAGREAILRWKAASSRKYAYTVEPLAVAQDGERTIVTGRVTGNFPGSPADLRYSFVLEADKIARLEIGQ